MQGRFPLVAILALATLANVQAGEPISMKLIRGEAVLGTISLPPDGPLGEAASVREHAVAWHPTRRRFYLVGDVIRLSSPHHPNTYESELHLWSSPDLNAWQYHGVAVPKGSADCYDAHGVASPAGMVFHNGQLWVPFSARRTAEFRQRGIGLAWSGDNPADLPWTKTTRAISDTQGEDDDPALLCLPGDPRVHLYHRTTAPDYHIVHTASATPQDPGSWPQAQRITKRPQGVRAQELTGAIAIEDTIHLFVIEQGDAVQGIQISHLFARKPDDIFSPAGTERYLTDQPRNLAYGGHFTPVTRDGQLVAGFWTVMQHAPRYGLRGHALTLRQTDTR